MLPPAFWYNKIIGLRKQKTKTFNKGAPPPRAFHPIPLNAGTHGPWCLRQRSFLVEEPFFILYDTLVDGQALSDRLPRGFPLNVFATRSKLSDL